MYIPVKNLMYIKQYYIYNILNYPFSEGKYKGAKNHTHRKRKIKIGQPRSKTQAKTYPKTLKKSSKIFEKENLVRWGGGGLRGHKGKYFVHKSNKE